jgi:prepilin-type N-terminal cleavage/methylation domain-containing protein
MGNKNRTQYGFTIIEMMIALLILSMIILATTVAIIGFGRQYQKGSFVSQANNASRNLHQAIGLAMKYGDNYRIINSNGDYKGFCSGTDKYFWKVSGRDIADPSGIFLYKNGNNNSCDQPNNVEIGNSSNQIPANAFVTEFRACNQNESPCVIKTVIKIGTKDMFEDEDITKNCLSVFKGGDFCSSVEYSSTVQKIIGGN